MQPEKCDLSLVVAVSRWADPLRFLEFALGFYTALKVSVGCDSCVVGLWLLFTRGPPARRTEGNVGDVLWAECKWSRREERCF